MNYLLDKKAKRKRFFHVVFFAAILLVLFYFRLSIWSGFSYASHKLFRPALVLGNNVGERFSGLASFFLSKKFLYLENENLKLKLNESQATVANYNSVLAENISLKEVLGRRNEKQPMVLSSILSKPNKSLYDTLIIDAGVKQGLRVGDMVFALGNVPIGRVAETYSLSSKVILFSNSGEKTQAMIGDKNIFVEIIGRGGGNFEMIIPRDFVLSKGDEAVLPGIKPYVLGIVETAISDPRDPFVKALLVSPVNVQELKFVEVKIN